EIRVSYITLLIADKSVNESGFHVLRRVKGSGAAFASVAEYDPRLGNNITIVFRDETIATGNTYEYKVNVFDRYGNNADTPIIEASAFPSVPQPPSQVLFDGRTTNAMTVHWRESIEVVDKYHLTIDGPSGTQHVDVDGRTFERTLSGLSPGKQYCVTITAENITGVSRPTEQQCAYTRATRPSSLPLSVFDLRVDAPQVTLINDHGGDPIADTYRFP